MIDLHYWPTPNGHKITMFLEETGLEYKMVPVHIGRGEQFKAAFLKIAPNNRMPAIVDHDPAGGGEPVSVFESGAILLYLAEKTGKFIPPDMRGRVEVLQWLFWQMGGLGPMAGQNHHFVTYAPEKIPYAMDRYVKETSRLYAVLDKRLADREFAAGDYSIADMAAYPWIVPHKRQKQNLDDFPNLKRWFEAIRARPATVRAYEKGAVINSVPVMDEEAKRIMFGQTADTVRGEKDMTIQLYDLATADPELRFSPFCWRVKMALVHKGLEWDEIPILFTEKQKLPAGNVGTVPVLADDGIVVNDSWVIAEYLDKKYLDNPLFTSDQSRAHALLIKYWVDKTVHPFITGMGVGDFMETLDERDKPYFNETREKRLGVPIAQYMQKREQSRDGFRKSLEPLRAMLAEQAFIGGGEADYADYIVFGDLQWMRCGSPYPSLERDDPVFQYRERMLDLYDGFARRAKFREIMD